MYIYNIILYIIHITIIIDYLYKLLPSYMSREAAMGSATVGRGGHQSGLPLAEQPATWPPRGGRGRRDDDICSATGVRNGDPKGICVDVDDDDFDDDDDDVDVSC